MTSTGHSTFTPPPPPAPPQGPYGQDPACTPYPVPFHKRHRTGLIITGSAIAGFTLIGAIGAAVSGHNSGSGSTGGSGAGTSQTASQVLTSDGYTVVANEDRSTINGTFGAAAPYVTSAAAGTSGGNEELVIVITPAGISAAGGASALQDGVGSQMPPGTTTTLTGDDLRVSGPAADFTGF